MRQKQLEAEFAACRRELAMIETEAVMQTVMFETKHHIQIFVLIDSILIHVSCLCIT
jgi:hypothetical protein